MWRELVEKYFNFFTQYFIYDEDDVCLASLRTHREGK